MIAAGLVSRYQRRFFCILSKGVGRAFSTTSRAESAVFEPQHARILFLDIIIIIIIIIIVIIIIIIIIIVIIIIIIITVNA